MKPVHHLSVIVPVLALALGLSGCNDSTTRSDYPDQTQQTKAEADAIRRDGEQREALIERDLQQNLTSLSFAQQQNASKAKLERERIELERDQKVQPLEAKKSEVEAKAKRDAERIDQETDAKVASANGDEAIRLKADAASSIADVKRDAATRSAEIDAEVRAANQAAQSRIAHVNDGEAKEQADIAAKRAEAERTAREAKLKVKSDTTAKLDRVGKDSAERRDEQRTRDAEARKKDEEITSAVQKDLAKHGESVRGVTVATDNGVVVLGGAVTTETVRQKVVSDAQKISGVVRVDDRIAVH
ncbi:MAG TPA: BON domain-containing protein [Planctomycetota bacterium]|jgi:colicin import membrane protein|nr:BON domain-containing protein [Planctomycetota bacterium]